MSELGVAPSRAVRLTFAYEGGRVTMVDRRTIDVIVPPSDQLPSRGDPRGFWAELRDEQEHVLHRRVLADLWRQDAEVFSPDPERSVARMPLDRPSGAFSVLLPAPEEADHVTLMGASTPGVAMLVAPGADAEGAVELARFPIR